MKRIIALLLVAVMMLTMFVACNKNETPDPTDKPTDKATGDNTPTDKPTDPADEPDLEAAKEFLKAQVLKTSSALTTTKTFDVPAQIKRGTLTYTVEWKSSLEAVTVAESATAGFATVTIPATNEEETTYTLTATIKYGEESIELVVNCVLPVIDNAGITSDLQEEVAYKMFLYQGSFAQNLYATHAMDQDKYYKTTNDAKEAPDFFAEKVDGGYKFYTMIEGAKKYVNAYLVYDETNDKYSKRLNYVDATDNVWTYEADTNAWFVNLPQGEETVKYVLGTYGDFKTFCISEASYISPSNTGITQFPANFITKEVAESKTPDEEQAKPIPQMENPLQPEVGTAYKFGFVHGGKDNAVYYVTGSMSSYYLATSENVANGANFYVEAAEGGYYLYFLGADSAKTYLNVVVNGTHINAVYGAEPVSVYVWDADLKTLKTTLDGTEYIIGTSATQTYTTLQPAKTEGSFYAQFVAVPEGGETPVGPQEVTLADAAKLDDGTKVIIKGVVVEIKEAWTDQYKNNSVYISDGANTFYVFRTETQVALGDFITVEGEIGSYNGAKQIAKGATVTITAATALDAAAKLEDGTAVVIKGKVSEIKEAWTDQYKNNSVYITDGTNTFYVFRTNFKLDLNDEVVVVGEIGSYNGAKQIAKGAMAVVTTKAPTEGGEEGGEEEVVIEGEKFSIAANTGVLSNENKTITWTSDNYTIANNQGASTSAIRTSDADHFRVYAKSDFAVSAKNDKKIVKVTIVCQNEGYATKAVESLTTDGAKATADENVVTIVAEAGVAAVEFTATAQFRVTDIYVVFA
ncbi:MAG: hypothetical protein J6M03_00545 [Clostridia bacterium]|nr:hypothetical protein [Clostridia bacterium]